MRITTFIAGMAIGALAGMCLADRRSLSQLQSKFQLAGDVVTDVMGKAKGKVMETAFQVATNTDASQMSSGSSAQSSTNASSASTQQTSSASSSYSLETVKDLIERDPEVKRQVDAIIRESSAVKPQATVTTHVQPEVKSIDSARKQGGQATPH
ncbi:DNA-directed RNA polymerase [Paenibacillus sp. 1001270B_150601_E10]|uniref:DNA-directed RNA polymerase n=1 Tax=Paenibacillus sp. 1001270B_150601_E10 TaxID=2787079 RepID=UPI0018A1120D|nr:DNA-directed RNA polymerase [Paenibacillus sp. 1001270B_150601_E10]